MIIDASQIIEELAEIGMFPEALNDGKYFCPAREWVEEYMSWFYKNNPYRYKKDKFDCDNFAKRAWAQADESLQENLDIQDADHTFCFANLKLHKFMKSKLLSLLAFVMLLTLSGCETTRDGNKPPMMR